MADRRGTVKGGTLYCRPELKGKGPLGKTSKIICPDCKFRIGGKGHEEGSHHKQGGKGKGSRRR